MLSFKSVLYLFWQLCIWGMFSETDRSSDIQKRNFENGSHMYVQYSNADVVFDKNYLDVDALPYWFTLVDANTRTVNFPSGVFIFVDVLISRSSSGYCLTPPAWSKWSHRHGQVHLQRLEQSDAELSTTRWCNFEKWTGRGVVRSCKAVILWVVPLPSTSGTWRSNEGL